MSNETRSLSGTVVAVTGASSGIGRATARALVEAGARVAITARRADRLADLQTELGAENVVWVAGDIAEVDTNNALVAAAVAKFGTLDSLVASAGQGNYGGVLEMSDDEVSGMIDTNFTGTVWGVRAAVPELLKAGGGDIVIVSSVAGIRGGADEAVYAGTKAAQLIFAGALDRELREKNIRVTTLCPAAVNTEFAIGLGREEGAAWLDDVIQPEDVAAQIVFALQQPRRIRSGIWSLWSAAQAS
jgi:3-oxoacyl-[acyl-carrier protein] reductase